RIHLAAPRSKAHGIAPDPAPESGRVGYLESSPVGPGAHRARAAPAHAPHSALRARRVSARAGVERHPALGGESGHSAFVRGVQSDCDLRRRPARLRTQRGAESDQRRKLRRSHVLFMPQYDEPFTLRVLQTLLDVIREYPDYSNGSRHWDERVFHPDHAGVIRPLASLWVRPPFYVRHFFSVVRLLELDPVRRAMRLALARPQQQVPFALGGRQEVAP